MATSYFRSTFRSAVCAVLVFAPMVGAQNISAIQARFLADRLTYGAQPADIAAITGPILNYRLWLRDQLDPDLSGAPGSDDPLLLSIVQAATPSTQTPPANFLDGATWKQLSMARVARATLTQWQVNEVMTQFWEQHFNVNGATARDILVGQRRYRREHGEHVAAYHEWTLHEFYRQNALGDFADLIANTTVAPTMMLYLNMVDARDCGSPNQNYARELLELFTMGQLFRPVGGGQPTLNYTQDDIEELARALTGWDLNPPPAMAPAFTDASILITPASPTSGSGFCAQSKTIFAAPNDITLPGANAVLELRQLLEHIAGMESTKNFICRKLMKVFLRDDADSLHPILLNNMIGAWGSRGDIGAVVAVLFNSGPFWRARYIRSRGRMPLEGAAAWLRIWDADLTAATGAPAYERLKRVQATMERIGQSLFRFPSPDGFPIESIELPGSSVNLESYKTIGDLVRKSNDPANPNVDPAYPVFDMRGLAIAALPNPADRNNETLVAQFLLDRLFGSAGYSATDLDIVRRVLILPGPLDWTAVGYEARLREAAVIAATHKNFLVK